MGPGRGQVLVRDQPVCLDGKSKENFFQQMISCCLRLLPQVAKGVNTDFLTCFTIPKATKKHG
jgi:hypothetical protein